MVQFFPTFPLGYFLLAAAAATTKSLQLCPTLCDPVDGSPPGSPIPGILQARTLEWVAISFSNAWKWEVKVKSLSGVRLFLTPWTAAYQAPLSMGFSRHEYWSGVPSPLAVNFFSKNFLKFCCYTESRLLQIAAQKINKSRDKVLVQGTVNLFV